MNILAEIVEKLKPRLEERKRALPMEALAERAAQAPARPKFADAFRGDGVHIIAELKKASPSKGLIRNDLNVKSLATELAANGNLVAISPQGHRQPGKNPADTEYKSGAALVAYRSGVPIIPICIKMKRQKYRIFRRTEIIIGKPLSQEELGFVNGGSAEYRDAAAKVFNEICRLGNFERTLPAAADEQSNG